MPTTNLRYDWLLPEVIALFELPFFDLLYKAQSVHRAHFDANAVQLSTLLSIKTGGCPEDCKYCPQSVHYDTGVNTHPLLPIKDIVAIAVEAKANGASRFCMGAAWRSPTKKQITQVAEMISAVRDVGLETCVTLGMLDENSASKLSQAGLDYYNHNLDTSPEFYGEIISTRTYQDRLNTLKHVRNHHIKVCCGGIVGMGESRNDRAELLKQLSNLPEHPESVPINMLVKVEGTPSMTAEGISNFEFIRTVAIARIMMPASFVRLSAGRSAMSAEAQALCIMAGANSVFMGEKLLTTSNPEVDVDTALFSELGIKPLLDTPLTTPVISKIASDK
ncbi:MAG: biotin synthase BioB [Pseudomonadales bacterium]|nr:biotin synthase BioB [Pseudomonadales bacterium]